MLVQYSKTFDSSYSGSIQNVRLTDAAKDLVLLGFVQGGVESGYRQYVRVKKLVRSFSAALLLVENINGEAASSESATARGVLAVPHLDNAMLLSAEEHGLLLYFEAAAAHTRSPKQNLAVHGRVFLFLCRLCFVRPQKFAPLRV